ncbi:MAG: Phosphoribosylamine--glycine ligase [Burkholderia sp.]|jgi:hypothetical protein
MTTIDQIEEAIKNKSSLAFAYHGFDRVVSPYAVGLSPTNEVKMIGFQTGGGSHSGVTEKLRFYTVADIAGLEPDKSAFRDIKDEDRRVIGQLAKVYAEV